MTFEKPAGRKNTETHLTYRGLQEAVDTICYNV